MRHIFALLEIIVLAVLLSSTANAKAPPAPPLAPAAAPEVPSFTIPDGVEIHGGFGISPTPSCVCPPSDGNKKDGYIFIGAK